MAYEFQWINDPPVVEVTQERMALAVQAMALDLADRKPVAGTSDSEIRWNYHIRASQEIFKQINQRLANHKKNSTMNSRYYAYYVAGTAVALMTIVTQPGYLLIGEVVTHQLTESAGGLMIEYAVNLSEAEGKAGQLRLIALNLDTLKPYLRLGFEQIEEGEKSMILKPAEAMVDGANAWVRPDGHTWKLSKSARLKYLQVNTWT